MRKYRGYYIDGIQFESEAQIDSFIESQAVESYKRAVELFNRDLSLEASIYCSDLADQLARKFGYTYAQIEEIELSVY